MSNEKTYTPGAVNISTEEYRDLITELTEAKNDYNSANSKRYEAEKERNEARRELAELQIKFNKLHGFICSDEALKTKYKLYILETSEKEES